MVLSIGLYELAQGYRDIISLVDEDSPDSDIVNALKTLEGAIEGKAISIANIIKMVEAESEVIKAEEKRLSIRRRSRENAVESMKNYLQGVMTQLDIDSFKTPTRSISLQQNPPSLYISNPDIIPQKYLALIPATYVPRNEDIKKALKDGEIIAGAELQSKKGLRIR